MPGDLSRLSVPPCSGALRASVEPQLLPAGGRLVDIVSEYPSEVGTCSAHPASPDALHRLLQR